jgi:hypothetical protein
MSTDAAPFLERIKHVHKILDKLIPNEDIKECVDILNNVIRDMEFIRSISSPRVMNTQSHNFITRR